ncbi:MAG TPA: hypothetical protein VI197_21385 [Polyangiaceae bacterium]
MTEAWSVIPPRWCLAVAKLWALRGGSAYPRGMKRLALLGAITLSLGACEPAGGPTRARDAEPEAPSADPLLYRSRQVAHRLEAALSRLAEPMPAVSKFHTTPCPDGELSARVTEGAGSTLALGIHDARYEARSLFPLELLAPLEPPAPTLDRYFEVDPRAEALPGAATRLGRLLRSEADARAAEHEVDALERYRYKGVFHITLFKKPHLIRKENRRKREWTRGVFEAWLVVYDIDTSQSLCQVRVSTLSDVEGEPITIRLRPDTQRKLVRELGQQLYAESVEALGSITRVLRLDPPEIAPADKKLASLPTALGDPRHSPGRQ